MIPSVSIKLNASIRAGTKNAQDLCEIEPD